MAAAGDFLLINLLRKENSYDLVQDHSSEAGCHISKRRKVMLSQFIIAK
jgi:hypothetical protein